MPVKRAIMLGLKDTVLQYALRFDALVRPNPNYQSSYGSRQDPDVKAIREGHVEEVIKTRAAAPQGDETTDELLTRLDDELISEWTDEQSKRSRRLTRAEVFGRSWDGRAWGDYDPGKPLSAAAMSGRGASGRL